MATWRFDVQNCLTLMTFMTSANTMWIYFSVTENVQNVFYQPSNNLSTHDCPEGIIRNKEQGMDRKMGWEFARLLLGDRRHCLSAHLIWSQSSESNTGESFVLRKIFPCFLQCEFNAQTVVWLWKLSKRLHASLPRDDICKGFKFRQLGGHWW